MAKERKYKGFVIIHRSMQDHWLWKSEKFSKAQAWIDLILLASHSERAVMSRGVWVDLERGQVGVSKTFLAERWSWSRPKVDRYIDRLKNEQMIEVEKNAVGTVITVLNYDTYQSVNKKRAGNVTPNVTPNVTTDVTTRVTHLKNVNKTLSKELKEDDSFFE